MVVLIRADIKWGDFYRRQEMGDRFFSFLSWWTKSVAKCQVLVMFHINVVTACFAVRFSTMDTDPFIDPIHDDLLEPRNTGRSRVKKKLPCVTFWQRWSTGFGHLQWDSRSRSLGVMYWFFYWRKAIYAAFGVMFILGLAIQPVSSWSAISRNYPSMIVMLAHT